MAYFQIDLGRREDDRNRRISSAYTPGTIFVEVAADVFANSLDDAAIDSAAAWV